ncbi:MAG: GNAT family N-acetyltransferase [Chloroflexota bacterium]
MATTPPPAGAVVSWRPLRLEDAGALTALQAACRRAEGEPDEVPTVDKIRHELEEPGSTLADDTLGGWGVDGRLLAYARIWCRPSPTLLGRGLLHGDVHPVARRTGVGSALIDWQAARAEERLRAETPPGVERRMELHAPSTDLGRAAIARRARLLPTRWFHKMTRPLVEHLDVPRIPAGLEMVAWTDAVAEAALEARNDAWQDHWAYEPMPRATWQHRLLEDPLFLRPASRLVLDDGRIVGLVLCAEQATSESADGRTGIIDAVAVRRAWRRRGVGAALIGAALVALHEEGFRTAALHVDAASPTGALGLYERLGFHVLRTTTAHSRDV